MSASASNRALKITFVCGEPSGDILGEGLVKNLKQHYPNATIEGIPGPKMQAAGCKPIFPMEKIAAAGLFEIIGRLWEILAVRRALKKHFLKNLPDVFIGIDAPDFNLSLERFLRRRGVKTVHYVSPSVWAWRQGRIKTIAQSVDLMLTLFPFEVPIYKKHNIPVCFVGHPTANQIPLEPDKTQAKKQLGFHDTDTVVAILPGSRQQEITYLAETFFAAARYCTIHHANLKFVVPTVTEQKKAVLEALHRDLFPDLDLCIFVDKARESMIAAEVVLLASGTATLECMLVKRPMVVAYKVAPVTYWILKKMLKVTSISLPNLLADEPLVPEYIQADATKEKLGEALLEWLNHPEKFAPMRQKFTEIHELLRVDADKRATAAVIDLVESKDTMDFMTKECVNGSVHSRR